jgi:hypothetical protein
MLILGRELSIDAQGLVIQGSIDIYHDIYHNYDSNFMEDTYAGSTPNSPCF